MVAFQGKQAACVLSCLAASTGSSRKVCGCFPFLLEAVAFEDGQPVVLEDGSMAFIHSTAKGEAFSALSLAAGEKLLECLRFPRLGR